MSNDNEPIQPASEDPGTGADSGSGMTPATGLGDTGTEAARVPDTTAVAGPVVQENEEETAETGGMSFFDHLDEIRMRLFKAGIFFVLATIVSGVYADILVNRVLIGPLTQSGPNIVLQNLVPYGQITLYLQVVLFSGFVLSFPALAWHIWKFVEPGLHERERKASRFVTLFISACFFSGIAFGYFVFLPISLKFFAGFGSPLIKNNIAVADYVSFVLSTLLTAGLVFELPFISYVLSKVGLLTPAFMRFYRKHSVVAMLVIAAIVTPSTDLVTQMVIAVPMIILYEISIYISAAVQRNRNRKELLEH
ncbi:MAG: twin-arginine translocase subunit TatC [Chlorobiaceae bacterium]|nr:twin-arginine translocase subunit TatC [Chlorobiaceae bacterium]